MDKFAAAPWWTVTLVVVIARLAAAPDWTGVIALCVLLAREVLQLAAQHVASQKLLSDTARLAHLETEVRSLNQAINLKFGRN